MKNMRKTVAILAAVLMLFTVLPMSAFAAVGDVAFSANFDNGLDGFASDVALSNDGGYLTFNAPDAAWVTAYAYANNIQANTMYEVTFKAKADKDGQLGVQIGNGWSGHIFREFVDVTTEWQEYTVSMSDLALTETALFQFLSNYDASVAPIFYIDDVNVVEVLNPALIGKVVNPDFETGEANGWNLPQSGGVKAEAAHDGAYGINIKGGGSYGGMLDQTFPVNAGKAYEISFWVKVNANGINIQIKDGGTSGTNMAGDWVDMNKAGEWKQFTYIVRPTQDTLTINFCGAGNKIEEDAYVDSFTCVELIDPSFDGYIYNGDFETGKTDSWESVWGSAQISIVEGRNGGSAMLVQAGQWQVVRQKVAVQPNTDYVVKAYGKNASNMTLLVKDGNDSGNIAQAGFASSEDFKATSVNFNSGDYSEVYICVMGNVAGSSVIVDDFLMWEKVEASNDGYLINGTFETGDIAPWDNLWGSCPKAEVVKGGVNDNFSLDIVSGLWKHVRQTNIAVEANTDYKITLWAKNASGMSLLVKDGGDSKDIQNAGISADAEWTEFVVEFNTGDYTTIIVSLMGNSDNCYGSFDNIVMEKVAACEHEYDDCMDADCNLCGETREPGHNLTYFEAVVAANCQETGHDEYWYCDKCGCYFGDAEASWQLNPGWLFTPGECVRPEDAADCATVPCTVCGNDTYGYGEHDVLACQGGVCSKCNAEIEGYGCQNYDTPACEDGVCYYCGGFVAGFGHENGAWAACQDGECSYGCGLIYPATEDHADADGDDYCDNCWSHLNHDVDPCLGGECSVCWELIAPTHANIIHMEALAPTCAAMGNLECWYCDLCGQAWLDAECTLNTNLRAVKLPATGEHTYDDDYDADCNVCGDVREVPDQPIETTVYGDANGDGEVTGFDAALLQQFVAGWDVELGPEEAKVFNDATLGWE